MTLLARSLLLSLALSMFGGLLISSRDAHAQPASTVTAEAKAAKGVENRQPVGEGTSFTKGEEVWVWTMVKGAKVGDVIKHVWKKDGTVDWTRELKIGGPRWTTNSRRKASPGKWTVEVQAADGSTLTQVEFTVQ